MSHREEVQVTVSAVRISEKNTNLMRQGNFQLLERVSRLDNMQGIRSTYKQL